MPVAYVRRRPDVGEAQPRPECAEPLEHSRGWARRRAGGGERLASAAYGRHDLTNGGQSAERVLPPADGREALARCGGERGVEGQPHV